MSGITAMCVGGPDSGHTHHVLYGDRLEVPIYERMPMTVALAGEKPELRSMRTFRYRLVRMTWGGEVHLYWIPEGVPEEATAVYIMRAFESAIAKVST